MPSVTVNDAAGAAEAPSARYQFADVEFDELRGELKVAGTVVEVEPRPLRLLADLLHHADEVVTKSELLERVWDGRPTVEHVLPNAVSKLRTALGASGAARLLTVARVGYRLQGPVRRIDLLAAQSDFQAGQPVPRRPGFVLESPLGQGAQSDVWLARHAGLGHVRVFKFADDGARLSALKREYTLYRVLRQELGTRADFATVVDTNFTAAPYFLECEYGGLSLHEWALAEDQAEPGRSRLAAMPQQARVALFVQMAAAVAAAHSVGVLHKDLKPGNVLIDGGPGHWQARLTDFGSGRLLDRSRLAGLQLTALGLTQQTQETTPDSLSGTLMYLAPEVMAGQSPSVQSDVYALGLMLFQMLVGDLRRPLVTGWQRDINDPLLAEDVAAATEGRPEDRLPSAADLVQRLLQLPQRRAERERLAQEAATRQALALQVARARQRRPWVMGAALSLALGLVASLWQTHVASRAQASAEQAQGEAAAVNSFLTRDVLVAPDQMLLGASRPETAFEMLRRAADTVSERFRGHPLVEADVRRQLARTFRRIGRNPDSRQQFETAAQLYAAHVPASDHRALANRFEWVLILLESQRVEQGLALFQSAQVDLASATPARGGSDLAFRSGQARVGILIAKSEFAMALAEARALLATADAMPAAAREERLEARRQLAELQIIVGDGVAADATIASLAVEPTARADVASVIWAGGLSRPAQRLRNEKRWAETDRMLSAVRQRLLAAPHPSQFHLGYNASEWGHAENLQGHFDRAQAYYLAAINGFTQAFGPAHRYVVITEHNLASMELEARHCESALQRLQQARQWLIQPANGGASGLDIDFPIVRAMVCVGRFDDAMALADQLPTPDASAGQAQRSAARALALAGAGRRAEGEALMRAAVAHMQGPDDPPWIAANLLRDLALIPKR